MSQYLAESGIALLAHPSRSAVCALANSRIWPRFDKEYIYIRVPPLNKSLLQVCGAMSNKHSSNCVTEYQSSNASLYAVICCEDTQPEVLLRHLNLATWQAGVRSGGPSPQMQSNEYYVSHFLDMVLRYGE